MMNRVEMNENMVERVNGGYLVDNGDGTYTLYGDGSGEYQGYFEVLSNE